MLTGTFDSIHKDERRRGKEEHATKYSTLLMRLEGWPISSLHWYFIPWSQLIKTSSDILNRGKSMKTFAFSIIALVASTVPVSAITVTAPVDGAQVTSPFTVTASTTFCDSQAAASMGYSIDNGASTIVHNTQLSAVVIAGDGPHVLHVKCWVRMVRMTTRR